MRRSRYRSQPGQVLVLLGLLMVVILVAIGLAVDVSRTQAEQRNIQLASNAAALAGVSLISQMERDPTITDSRMLEVIRASFEENHIGSLVEGIDAVTAEQVGFIAWYADKDGRHLGPVGQQLGNKVPPNAWYVMVSSRGQISTYFAQLVGQDALPAGAEAAAGMCPSMNNVYPIIVNEATLPAVRNTSFTVSRTTNATSTSPSAGFDWLTWIPGDNADSRLSAALIAPGTLMEKFQENPAPGGATNGEHERTLENGDWVARKRTDPGTGIATRMSALISAGKEIILPIGSNYRDGGYQVARLGYFKVTSFSLTGGSAGRGQLGLTFLGEDRGQACLVPPPPPCEAGCTDLPPIEGYVTERLMYREERGQTQDILIVFDASYSMRFGWNCHANPPCPNNNPPGDRMTAARNSVNAFIDEVFKQDGIDPPDDHVGLVVFGVSGNKAIVKHPFVDHTKKSSIKGAVSSIASESNTPTATGLKLALDTLATRPDTRMVTVTNGLGVQVQQSKRVKKIIFLVTDGMANVRLGLTNLNDDGRVFNGVGRGDDVAFQKTSVVTNPSAAVPRAYTVDPPNSPIMQAVAQANAAKGSKMEVFVIGTAFFNNSMDYMEFDEMASNPLDKHMFDARTPGQMTNFVLQAREFMETERCVGQPMADRPAAGAQVWLYDAITNDLVANTTTNANGFYRFNGVAPDRTYRIITEHRGVRGPDSISRNYTWMNPSMGGSELTVVVDADVTGTYRADDVLLTIERTGTPPTPVNVCQ